jgi:hypothetical protein
VKPFDELGRWLKAKLPEVASSVASAVYELDQTGEVRFTTADRKKARPLVPILRRSAKGDWATLPKPVGRTAFLAAASSLVRDADIEWAVVGLGTGRERGRSFIRQVIARPGSADRALLPVTVLNDMRGHLETEEGGEDLAILFTDEDCDETNRVLRSYADNTEYSTRSSARAFFANPLNPRSEVTGHE